MMKLNYTTIHLNHRATILTLLLSNLPLSRQDLLLLIAWPLFNAFIVCSALYYIMLTLYIPLSATLISNVMMAVFLKCALFWLFRRIFEANCEAAISLRLFYQIVINLALISLAFAISDIGFTAPATFDSITVFQLFRLKLLTYLNMLLQVTIYTVVIHSWQLNQRALELEMSLKQSEISLLRIQTNPHFLFNTLNLLHSEIPERPELAQKLIFELSDLLRGTIAISDKRRILLSDEIVLIEHYLAIQKARFTERLDVKMLIDSTSQGLCIPPMLILPLVENVIKHALRKTTKRVTLEIKTRYIGNELSILVSNNWPGNTIPEYEIGSGHRNISETLRLEYLDATLSINFDNQVTCALVAIRHDFIGEPSVPSVVD